MITRSYHSDTKTDCGIGSRLNVNWSPGNSERILRDKSDVTIEQ